MSLTIDLRGKRALVSGVSSGIGGGVAKMLAKAGCDVSGCGLELPTSEGAKKFVGSVENEGGRATYFSLDLTNPEEIERWVETSADALGGIDIVVSNAGVNTFSGVEKSSEADWEFALNINLASHWRLARAAYPYLKESGNGVVIVMTSNHAFYTIPGGFPYNVAKAGLLGLVQSMAIDWGPQIRAIGIAPGYVATNALQKWLQTNPELNEKMEKIKAIHPVKRIGTVDEIGALCAFLCSEWGGFITGTTYLVDGGRSALME